MEIRSGQLAKARKVMPHVHRRIHENPVLGRYAVAELFIFHVHPPREMFIETPDGVKDLGADAGRGGHEHVMVEDAPPAEEVGKAVGFIARRSPLVQRLWMVD